MKPRTLLLIDGHYFLLRSFAVPFSFSSRKGTPLHVPTMFLKLIRRSLGAIRSNGKETSIVVVFDTPRRTSNHKLFEEYKSNRKQDYSQDEDSPFRHLPQIKKVLRYLGIPMFKKNGIEADDLIASLANHYLQKFSNGNVFISSRDSDFYQLLSPQIKLIHLQNGSINELIDRAWLAKTLGVHPSQYIRYKSLIGDPSDAIPGVPGIGPIRALRILQKKFVFDFKRYQDIIQRNTKLITLNASLRIPILWSKTRLKTKLLALSNQEIFKRCRL